MSRSAVLTGRTIAALIRNVFVVVLMMVVGMAVGFRFSAGVIPAVGAVLVALLLGYSLSWVFAFMRLSVANPAPTPVHSLQPPTTASSTSWRRLYAAHKPRAR